eukprot:CAMPEP_0175360848 /NCGR_PEP_ID=MMETSP0095-20121207/16249_1 /TAXON_ID=311494 /ORGANISM="Alexandrium monilatum, Strain CCMP3105" /LENGTH=607 /DNA_ID=CAMNT_0016658669 /DNA_START=36 /DNA_END=1859 /DNA_ORIENTATION=-
MRRDTASLLDRLAEEKDDFHAYRWRCVRYPDRAVETLKPYAQLEISIVAARRLNTWTSSSRFEPPSSPFVRVFVNDKKAFQTSPVRSAAPRWAHDGKIGVTAPLSMVRIQVLDYDTITHTEDVGFVEFCLGDLPWSKQVGTSHDRYASHSSGRDDEVDERHEQRQTLLRSPPSCGLAACGRAPRQARLNAGEVLVRLRLERLGTWLDSAYALALDPPPPKNFGVRAKATPTDKLPELDLQDLRDEITDIKLALFDGALVSTANFCGYVLQWRSTLLSLSVAAVLIVAWLLPYLTWVVIPALLAVFLVLFSSKRIRAAMTLGGANAPLSQEGFERVALWRSKASMVRFVRRVVEQDLQGTVTDEPQLATCAATVFSNGVPRISYQQLREGLRDAKWTSSTKDGLAPGSLVVVTDEFGHRRARVQTIMSGGNVSVMCDDGPEHAVRSFQVTPRPQVPTVPSWIFPRDFANHLRTLEMQMGSAKRALLGPVEKVSKVVTWQAPFVTFSITAVLLAISAAEATILLGLWGDMPGLVGSRLIFFLGVAMDFVKAAFRITVFVLGVLFLTYRSPLFVGICSAAKICGRLLTMRRRAPQSWPFFRETNGLAGIP